MSKSNFQPHELIQSLFGVLICFFFPFPPRIHTLHATETTPHPDRPIRLGFPPCFFDPLVITIDPAREALYNCSGKIDFLQTNKAERIHAPPLAICELSFPFRFPLLSSFPYRQLARVACLFPLLLPLLCGLDSRPGPFFFLFSPRLESSRFDSSISRFGRPICY